jgi:hypothetical protein
MTNSANLSVKPDQAQSVAGVENEPGLLETIFEDADPH